jgi:hypothetical protein
MPPACRDDNNMVIVEAGDVHVAHIGSTGGLRIGSVEVKEQERMEEIPIERLQPWIRALKNLDLNW